MQGAHSTTKHDGFLDVQPSLVSLTAYMPLSSTWSHLATHAPLDHKQQASHLLNTNLALSCHIHHPQAFPPELSKSWYWY